MTSEELLNIPYRNLIGSLAFVALRTRPDSMYAVNALSQFQAKPGIKHWNCLMRSLFTRMSALHKCGTLKPPSPGLEHVDVINNVLNNITEQELELQEVQNLLTTPEPIHDVQLQLVGYKQKKDDKGKKRSLNICPTTPKGIISLNYEKNYSISTDNYLESYELHKITQQFSRSDSIQDIKRKLQNIQRAVQEHLYFAVFYE
ncbi:hypothetical protein AVEN_180945-1 [Araneus ventricosus]|uniref:Retrovirus-related Pol polyprotein from transposon TNT 1-94 n=1 Tax=Araneus ventricosus TaxID=182803 RepID=A0A4Y2FKJ4_ARAVE|nr:hypothetical protein AVEN_180945-1 [Araneus ventricosus]